MKRRTYYWKIRNVPHEPPNIIFGNLSSLVTGSLTMSQLFNNICRKFEDAPFVGTYSFWYPSLLLKDPDLIQQILIKDFNNFYDVPFADDEKADPLSSNMLLAMRNPKWRYFRTKLAPSFTSGKLKMMFPLIKECSIDLIQYLNDLEGNVLEVKSIVSRFTTDVISSCALGIQANCFKHENSEIYLAGRKLFSFNFVRSLQTLCFFFAPKMVSLFKFKFLEPTAAQFMKRVFWETVKEREATGVKRNDLIDLLIGLKNEDNEMMRESYFSLNKSSNTIEFIFK